MRFLFSLSVYIISEIREIFKFFEKRMVAIIFVLMVFTAERGTVRTCVLYFRYPTLFTHSYCFALSSSFLYILYQKIGDFSNFLEVIFRHSRVAALDATVKVSISCDPKVFCFFRAITYILNHVDKKIAEAENIFI